MWCRIHLFFLTRQNEIILKTTTSQYAQDVQKRNARKDTQSLMSIWRRHQKNKTKVITREHPYKGADVSTTHDNCANWSSLFFFMLLFLCERNSELRYKKKILRCANCNIYKVMGSATCSKRCVPRDSRKFSEPMTPPNRPKIMIGKGLKFVEL